MAVPNIPEYPAGERYHPNEWREQAESILDDVERLDDEFQDQWQEHGSRDGNTIRIVPRSPDVVPSTLPIFHGKTTLPGKTPLDAFTAIRSTGFRIIWDVRIQSAHSLRCFSQHEFLFYLVWRGIGPIYSPRDIAGIQALRCTDAYSNRQDLPDFATKRIVIGYRSLDQVPGIPDTCDGCVRATIHRAGYILQANDSGGTDINYYGHVDLATSVPGWIASPLMSELPRCPARLRDAVLTFGTPPILIDKVPCVASQIHNFFADTRVVSLEATIIQAGTVYFYLDYDKMYTQGIVVTGISGDGGPAIRIREETGAEHGLLKRRLAIDLLAEGAGLSFKIVIEPRDKDGPDSGTGPGWW